MLNIWSNINIKTAVILLGFKKVEIYEELVFERFIGHDPTYNPSEVAMQYRCCKGIYTRNPLKMIFEI